MGPGGFDFLKQSDPDIAYDATQLFSYVSISISDYFARPSDTHFNLGQSGAYDLATQQGYSIVGWFYTNNLHEGTIIARHNATQGWRFGYSNTGQMRLGVDNTEYNSTATFSAQTWNFGAVVYKHYSVSPYIRLWLNGTAETVHTSQDLPTDITADVKLGRYNINSDYMAGRISQVAISHLTLSDEWIYLIYQKTRGFYGG